MPEGMRKQWVVDLVQRVPQATLSRAWGWIARQRRPKIAVSLLKHVFVASTGIDLSDAAAEIRDFATLEDLFVRKLRPGARRVDPDPEAIISPVDGKVGACGVVEDDTIMQIKSRSYSVSRLLDDPQEAERYNGGHYATLYLAPHNYHRIHAPVSGEVHQATLIPGALLPVFPEALERVDELFARNERMISYIDTPDSGRIAVVKVGATLVGRIRVAYDPGVYTNQAGQLKRRISYVPPKLINKGAELGAFELGSTVVLLAEQGGLALDNLPEGALIKMGERIGALQGRKRGRKRHSVVGSRTKASVLRK